MTFLHPEFLYYLLPPLAAVYLFVLIKKESHEHYFSKEIMDKLKVNSNPLSLKTRNSLLFLAGILIVIASAEPVLKDGTVRVKAIGGDILIALDISDSMLCEDIYPNRLELAKKKALELINKATKDRVGVIAFAKNSYLVSPISFDTKTVSFLLSKLDTSSITQKGTNILTMLGTVEKTNTSTDKKYLLILSDGGDETDFSAEIDFAKEKGIIVFVLGIGTEVGASIKNKDGSLIKYNDKVVISKLNESISELAIKTGGVYIQNTTSSKDIEAMFIEIINNSEHKELKSQEIQRHVPLFYYPIIIAILILLIAFNSIGKKITRDVPASVFILFYMILGSSPSVADMLDFRKLSDAKRFYEAKEYNTSAKIYAEYAKKTGNGEAYYNAGNSYYKEKEYLKALSAYSFSRLEDKDSRAKKLSNMGNTLVHLGTVNTLERAIKHYEASLKLKEDQFTRENLEAVKKALEDNKKKEEKEDGQKDKDKKYSEQKTDESGEDSDEADDKNNKNKNKDQNNKNGSKGKKSDNKVNPDDDKKNSDDGKPDENEGNNNDGSNNNNNNNEDSQEKIKELKDKNKKEVKNQGNNGKPDLKLQQMSDLEEAKWVKKLNSKQNTYLYRLNKQIEDDEKNEKPW
ncbi:protein 2 containing von Willebrand factor, type A domain [Sulfurimonas gotlandica GD1]|uniref:Protein 2 containing von Willebrand factor, type A domain n=1 Tax=Sulfurimonas gotlandica (strain DSM 19862 / JCM 16533 / GD1) TaxID=929558 RepID=B6BMA1_SULGG|nr:VWA domain-containing protein [Sulfurimonas gotlandica]EDZ61902.1 von Willebrand factor, type A [Sulfurimonas gotlandica GD1]EHP29321.1 protein 2 containing von Willebrand factor, type A domain [Sulfurimonas gotlandica GD1]